jgi:hypothetical protein
MHAANFAGLCLALVMYYLLVIIPKERLLEKHEENGIEHICAGVQALDDISDVMEDHRGRRMNALLQQGYSWYQEQYGIDGTCGPRQEIKNDSLLISIVASGALGRCWESASVNLIRGLAELGAMEGVVYGYLSTIAKECDHFSKLAEVLRAEMLNFMKTSECLGVFELSPYCHEVRRLLQAGPTACQ